MNCPYSRATGEFHGWECEITGGECALLFPDKRFCAALIEDSEEVTEQ